MPGMNNGPVRDDQQASPGDVVQSRAFKPARYLLAGIVLTGLFLPSLMGIVIRLALSARGVDVVTWEQGARWMLPLTLFFLPAYLLLAGLAYRRLLHRVIRRGQALGRWWHVFLGAYLGLVTISIYLLATSLQHIRDTAHLIAFWPLTLPWISLWLLAGAATGALCGGVLWRWRRRSSRP